MYEREPSTDLEEMSEAECLKLLEEHDLGRIAVLVGDQPLIFPVNYGFGHRIVSFHAARGTQLAHAAGAPVAFEIDGYDPSTGVGWSVVIQGVAVDSTAAVDDVCCTPGIRIHRLAIDPTRISGRRFARP